MTEVLTSIFLISSSFTMIALAIFIIKEVFSGNN